MYTALGASSGKKRSLITSPLSMVTMAISSPSSGSVSYTHLFPALFLGIALLLGFRNAPLAVLLTVFGSPIAVSSFTMAQQMGGDDKLAGQLVVFGSILSIGTMFLLIFFLKEMAFL